MKHKKRKPVSVPPPEERLCETHGKPIFPSKWLNGCRKVGCVECQGTTRSKTSWNKYNRSVKGKAADTRFRLPEAKARRAKRWEEEWIVCANHPDRRCNKSHYVYGSVRRCGHCLNHKADGSRRPAFARGMDWKNPQRKNYARRSRTVKVIKQIRKGLQTRRDPLKIFANITGMAMDDLNFPRG